VLVVGILGLLLGLLLKGAPLRIGLGTHWPAVLRLVPSIFHLPPTPTLLLLQVFRL
jgi:hypothetical protein